MAAVVRSAAFQPIRRLQGMEKLPEAERALLEQLNAIRLDLARLRARPVFTELKTGDYLAREEECVRYAPGTGGATLLLPTPRPENKGSRVTVLLENVTLGTLTVQCVGGLVNAATSQVVTLVSLVEFVCDGLAGWRSEISPGAVALTSLASQAADTFVGNVTAGAASPTAVNLSTLAGAGLAFAAHTLDVTGSTSITIASDQVQRAALTGAVTAAANANATAFGVLAAKSVLANATNASAVPAALAGSIALQVVRVNSANTALELSVVPPAVAVANVSITQATAQAIVSYAVPAACWVAGTTYRFYAHVVYAHTAVATTNPSFQIQSNGVVAATVTLTVPATAGTYAFLVLGSLTCRTTGAGGTLCASVYANASGPAAVGTAVPEVEGSVATATTALDTTAGATIRLTGHLANVVAANTLTIPNAYITPVL